MPPVRHASVKSAPHISISSCTTVSAYDFVQNEVRVTITTDTLRREATASVFTPSPITSAQLNDFSSKALQRISGQPVDKARLENTTESADLQLLSLAFNRFISDQQSGTVTRVNTPSVVPHFKGSLEQALKAEIDAWTDTLSIELGGAVFEKRKKLHKTIWDRIYAGQNDGEKKKMEQQWRGRRLRHYTLGKVKGYMKTAVGDKLLANGSVLIGSPAVNTSNGNVALPSLLKPEAIETGFVWDPEAEGNDPEAEGNDPEGGLPAPGVKTEDSEVKVEHGDDQREARGRAKH